MKTLRFALLVMMLLALAGPATVSAQGGVTYTSGFQVQNLEATTANVVVTFYNQDGTTAGTGSYTVGPNAARNFFPLTDVQAGFNGSVVISSDRNIRANTNLLGSGPANLFASSNGFQSGAATVNLPLIMCNNSGFDTWFNVQNAGGVDANVTITYIPASDGAPGLTDSAVIKPGAAKTFNQAVGSSTRNCSTLAAGARNRFIGSAQVVSTNGQPLVATVLEQNTTTFQSLLAYGGFQAGSTSIAAPLIMSGNRGFYTSIQVQNAGTAQTQVTVSYSPNTVGGLTPQPDVFTLLPGASKTLIQNAAPGANGSAVNNYTTIGRYIGGATVTNNAGQKLVAVVNEVRPAPAVGASYEGFDPAQATLQASAPLIMANNSSYYTSIQVQNVETAGSTQVRIHYGPNTVGTFTPQDEVFTVAAGGSKTIIQNSVPPSNGSTVNSWTARYVGSATVTSTTGKIVAVINQLSETLPGDQLASGDAFNY